VFKVPLNPNLPTLGWFIVHMLGPAMINRCTCIKFEVCSFSHCKVS